MPKTLDQLSEQEQAELREKIRLVKRISTSAWFECHGAIKPKVGPLLKPPELRANYLQRLKSQVVEFCLLNDRPCRMISLKPRQKGSSTFSVATGYRWGSNTRCTGAIIGGSHAQSTNLFRMLKTYAENDDFDQRNPCRVLDREARWANGSIAEQLTAKNGEAGRSGTYQWVVATEVARWALEGVSNAADLLSGLLKCVPNEPMTYIELDSTANGAQGDFYERWQGGITFDELKQGKDGFVKIFAAWFQFKDSLRDPKLEEDREQCVSPEKVEELRKQFGLDDWQIAWMQWAVREECKKDWDTFCEDYPFDAESAFRTSGRLRFNTGMLEKMVTRARINPPDLGNLDSLGERGRESYVWRPCGPEEARIIRWEQPRGGMRYLLSIDPMTGETSVSSKDPDNHAVGVIRAGFFESGRGWVPPKLVARLVHDWGAWERNKKYELRHDIDVLESEIWKLAQYYGNCLIVPEINMDRGLVELLKLRAGAQIYQREEFNRREQTKTKMLGWRTDQYTREMAVENLARAIREQGRESEGLDIFCPITLSELQTFITKASGRSEAMPNKKDDCVLQVAIGLMCINAATVFSEPRVEITLPWDLRVLEARENASQSGAAMRW
jgi:hypothetical protein